MAKNSVKKRDGEFKDRNPVKGKTPRSYEDIGQNGKKSSLRGTPFIQTF